MVRKGNKSIRLERKEWNCIVDDITVYVENLFCRITINKFNKVTGYEVDIQKLIAF